MHAHTMNVCWFHPAASSCLVSPTICCCLCSAACCIFAAGHVGYELSPFIPTIEGIAALLGCGLKGSAGLNTVQHHDMHHRWDV
jgi:hypothetical protein